MVKLINSNKKIKLGPAYEKGNFIVPQGDIWFSSNNEVVLKISENEIVVKDKKIDIDNPEELKLIYLALKECFIRPH